MTGRGWQRGFTLVELLLAITLMSLLLALAYGGLRAASRASIRGQDMLEETSRMRLAHQFVRRQLNQMLPLQYAGESSDADDIVYRFVGDERLVQFVAPMPGYLGNGGPHVQRLEIVDAEQGFTLQFSHALWQGFEPDWIYEREPVVLLEGLDYAAFEFMSRDENGVPMPWEPSWLQPEILPLAVRLDIGFGKQSSIAWPPLMATVRLDESSVRRSAEDRSYDETIRDLIRGDGSSN